MTDNKWQRGLVIFSLICAGEAIFTLPYHVTRFFRPTFLEVFDLTATELGVRTECLRCDRHGRLLFWWAISGSF